MAASCAQRVPTALIERFRLLSSPARHGAVSTGWDAIDAVLPEHGLTRGAIHEWLGVAESDQSTEWSPPLLFLVHIARQAMESAPQETRHLVWIGRPVWPYAPAFREQQLLARSLFVRASRPADRLWAADLALRSRAAAAVIIDARGFDLAATRRLQLAAEAGSGLGMLARPPRERTALSAATTRWGLSVCPSPTATRRWTVELLRCKGLRPSHAPAWTLEHDRATCVIRLVSDILDRPGRTETPAPPVRRTA